jgi:hypothetical protein
MAPRKQVLGLILAGLVWSAGCAHTQLRMNTVGQSTTLTTLYERQVLNNLAMFASNPDALPFFAIPGSGATAVTDGGTISAAPLNFASTLIGLGGSRNMQNTWALAPVTDPDKLMRMRCAYRQAIGYCAHGAEDCCDCCDSERLSIQVCAKNLVHDPCEKVGHYCGTYIRVCPESYDAFTRLVLSILDYTVNDPPSPSRPTKEIKQYIYDGDRISRIETYTALATDSGRVEIPGSKAPSTLSQPDTGLLAPEAVDPYPLHGRQHKTPISPFFEWQSEEQIRQFIFPR